MALSDFWQVKDHQVYNGKPLLNVYQVKRILAGANAGIIATAFLDTVVSGDLDIIQPIGVTRTTVEVENLDDVTDFASVNSSSFPGTLIGQRMPSFNSATIQFNRTRIDMKNGRKSFLAGTEAEQLDGEWVPGFITLLQSLAAVIMTPWTRLTSPGIDVVEFCIMKRFCVDPFQDPCQVYRLPNSDAEADNNHYVPTTSTTRLRVRSQVSRKVLI